MINRKICIEFICFIVIFLVGGCSALLPAVEVINTQPSSLVYPTITSTLETGIPTRINTPPPLIESFHTLSPDDAYIQLQDVLKNNANCLLPCWWGISPGKTTWKDARSFLSKFNNLGSDKGSNELFFVSVHLPLPEEKGTLSHTYKIKNDVVIGINAYVYDWSPFLYLSNILTEYGPPDEILLKTFRNAETGSQPFQVDLFYAKLGILLEYSGGNLNTVGDNLQNCFDNLYSPFIFIWSVDEPITVDEAIDKYLIQQPMPYPVPLDKATSMNIFTFYEIYKNPDNTSCLETPLELWP